MTKKDDHATKEDIAGLKSDITAIEAKLDAKIDATSKTLALEIVRTQAEVRGIKAAMSTKDDIERVMRSIDRFAADAIHYNRADATRGETFIKLETTMDDHERRISTLESVRPRPQIP